ncbi:MAG: hypothetical protein CFH01_01656 [Alphaproteobacteria bacterium MarineAlpha2_Bin1]|nr:MAG: hypothetical protein CFH01_01656 [Alphaproteobacteria bacterium MarineAlpha2_Bin1]
MSRRSQGTRSQNYWPGFVDALAALLLVIIFLLVVFVLAQIFLTEALSGRDKALEKLDSQVSELTNLLSLEKKNNEDLKLQIINLETDLDKTIQEKENILDKLSFIKKDISTKKIQIEEFKQAIKNNENVIKNNLIKLEELSLDKDNLINEKKDLESKYSIILVELEKSKEKVRELDLSTKEISQALSETKIIITRLRDRERELENKFLKESKRAIENKNELEEKVLKLENVTNQSIELQKKLEISKKETTKNINVINNLNAQITALRAQLEALQNILDRAEERDRKQKVVISDLGKKLNRALAQKVQELSKYRSEFFGKLREVLGDRQDILIVGDRFVLQSEVLFSSGSAQLEDQGKIKLMELAKTLLEIIPTIPIEINWILRVDGHTDSRPINNNIYASNWELSTARASNVVKFLIKAGIPPKNIAATGFASFQPLDLGNDEISYRRNRRIEFKLTEK